MKIGEYFAQIEDLLFTLSCVTTFKILKQVDRSKNGHLRVRVHFTDESLLEFSEFVTQNAKDEIQVITYSYHWSDNNHRLIRRWDNTPHFPALENFPHHIHLTESQVIPSNPMNIFRVLDEIEKTITPS